MEHAVPRTEESAGVDLTEFAELVLKTLDEQQRYFHAKGDDRTILLLRCKGLERQVREEAQKILDKQENLL